MKIEAAPGKTEELASLQPIADALAKRISPEVLRGLTATHILPALTSAFSEVHNRIDVLEGKVATQQPTSSVRDTTRIAELEHRIHYYDSYVTEVLRGIIEKCGEDWQDWFEADYKEVLDQIPEAIAQAKVQAKDEGKLVAAAFRREIVTEFNANWKDWDLADNADVLQMLRQYKLDARGEIEQLQEDVNQLKYELAAAQKKPAPEPPCLTLGKATAYVGHTYLWSESALKEACQKADIRISFSQ